MLERRKIGTKTLHKLKLEYEQLLHEKLIRLCREDPNAFVEYVGGYGNKRWLGQASIHHTWQQALSAKNRVLLTCPREHGKTSQILLRLLWELGRDTDLRVKLVCQSDDIAVKRLIAIIEQIEKNPRLKEVFPDLLPAEKGVWTKMKIYLKRFAVGTTDPSVEACGIMSTATGGRADLIIFDDPVDFRNAIQQPSLRETVKEAYANVWMNLLEENGRVWYIATPWHKDDLTHQLMRAKSYHKITTSIRSDLEPIWPEKWPKERLLERLQEIGTRAFDRAYRGKALSDEDALFPEELLRRCYRKGLKFGTLPKELDPEQVRYFMGVDIAAGKKSNANAYSVIFTIAQQGNIKVPVSIMRGRFTSPQLAQLVMDEMNHFNPELVYVESNNVQEALIQWINEACGTVDIIPPIRGFFTGIQKAAEHVGLPGISVELETGSWIIPDPREHEKPCGCGLCSWIKEMSEYPIGKYKDTVMGCWFAREAARTLTAKLPKISAMFTGASRSMRTLHMDEDDDPTLEGEDSLEIDLSRHFHMEV